MMVLLMEHLVSPWSARQQVLTTKPLSWRGRENPMPTVYLSFNTYTWIGSLGLVLCSFVVLEAEYLYQGPHCALLEEVLLLQC